MEFFKDKELKNELKSKNKTLYSDYLYLLTWVLRRNCNYDKAIKYIEKGLNDFKDDARFYHSRFLVMYAKDSDAQKNEDKIFEKEERLIQLGLYLEDIISALDLYPKILNNKSELISQNIEATLLNSKLYAELCILELTPNSDANFMREKLIYLRTNYLEKLKLIFKDKYKFYPEFLHTEATLENLESDYSADWGTRYAKIDFAIKSLTEALIQAKKLSGFNTVVLDEMLKSLKVKKKQIRG